MQTPTGYFQFYIDSWIFWIIDRIKLFTFFLPLDTWWAIGRVLFDETVVVGNYTAALIYLFAPFANWFGMFGIYLTDDILMG